MKKILILCVCTVTLLMITGCQNSQVNGKESGKINDTENQFPAFLVGTWKPAEDADCKWIFTFEPDGTISKFRHFVGMEFVVKEGGLVEPWKGGGKAIYDLGPCTAEYDGKTHQLGVTIIIEHYEISFPNGSMEGSFSDYLAGYVSEKSKTWQAYWVNRTEIIGGGTEETQEPKLIKFIKIVDAAK